MRLPPLILTSIWPYLAAAFLLVSCNPSDEAIAAEQDSNSGSLSSSPPSITQNGNTEESTTLDGRANTSDAVPAPDGNAALDILGLTLGMTPEEVASAMESISAVQRRETRDSVRGTDIEFLTHQLWLRDQEQLNIEYAMPPSDPVAIDLSRYFRSDYIPDKQLRAALQERYGEPGYMLVEPSRTAMVWNDGPNAEQCGEAVVKRQAAVCTGPWLRIDLHARESDSGRVLRPERAQLRDDTDSKENADQFQAYQAEIAARAERERLQGNQVPDL